MEDHIWNGNTLILWQGQLFLPVCHHRHSRTARLLSRDLRLVHSSSFSASFLSTSALTWDNSSWIRRVFVSSSSSAP